MEIKKINRGYNLQKLEMNKKLEMNISKTTTLFPNAYNIFANKPC